MHNLPIDLTEDGLKDQLAPFMKVLAIADYLCDKPKKKKFGHITFLAQSDGDRFLKCHGETCVRAGGLLRQKSHLKLSGADVYCKLSHRKPQDFALKALAHAAQQRTNPSRVVEEEGDSISFPVLSSSCGYCTFFGDELTYIPEVQWGDMGIVIFKKRNIIIKFDNNKLIRIPLNSVVELVWTATGSLVITLSTVPLFFYDQSGTQSLTLCVQHGKTGSRAGPVRTRLCSLGGKHSELVGQCLVYQFSVPVDHLSRKMEILKNYDITITFFNIDTRYFGDFQSQLGTLKRELAKYTKDGSLPFGFLFQLQALAYNAYLPPLRIFSLAKALIRTFKTRKSTGRKALSAESMRKLLTLIDWPAPYGEPGDFEADSLLEAVIQSEKDIRDGNIQKDGLFLPSRNLALIYRVMVTPSRITLHGPEMEPKNRILRRFPNHHEYFIRVQFCDENGQDIHFSPQVNNEEVFTRFKNVLKNGIQIAGRTYTFLGFSHSSLRSHSVWFSAPFVDDDGNLQTYFSIITAIGKFSNITTPAKCAARIGQAFSETPFAINLSENGVSLFKMKDVEVDSRVFSDGVGTLSCDVVDAIRSVLPSKKGHPTCFQIRLGGAKGMLALDERLEGAQVHLRPSMIKFESSDMRDLEICDVGSKPIPLFLNRQVIKIMEDMGISEDWFFKLQRIRVDQLRNATATTKNTAKFIKGQDVGEAIRLYKLFREFDTLQIDYKQDPFLRSIVEAVILRELRLLKHKARIPVKDGVTLFGIMDETGFLGENQVYVAYDRMGDRFSKAPGSCRLIVTRCPALHDGDVQYVSNVVPPHNHPLMQHRNCIIFSQKGTRDLPSQLSGGDLDGDLYNIIWDWEARPRRTFSPADYPRVSPVDIGRKVTKEDMADFFIDFMQSDRLGIIATKHMILADQMDEGTSHPDCKKLAQLHSTAVDFSKTGIPVPLNEMPYMNRYRPDFLAPGPQVHLHDSSEIQLERYAVQAAPNRDEDFGPLHQYYRSEKLLGKLYRAIDEHKIWSENIRTTTTNPPTKTRKPFWSQLIDSLTWRCLAVGAPAKWQDHVETARQIRSTYEDAIYAAMNNFSEHPIHPISELEVFIGHILNKTGVQTHRQRERSIKLKDEFDRIATWILAQMRPSGPPTGYTTQYEALERCLACVHVARERDRRAVGRRRQIWNDLQSFQAVAVCALLLELEEKERYLREAGGDVVYPARIGFMAMSLRD